MITLVLISLIIHLGLAIWSTLTVLTGKSPPWWGVVISLYFLALKRGIELYQTYQFQQSDFEHQILAILSLTIAVSLAIGVVSVNRMLNEVSTEKGRKTLSLRLAMNIMKGGIWELTIPTNEVTYSQDYEKMLGFSPGELPPIRDTWINLIHHDDRERVVNEADSFISGKSDYYLAIYRMIKKDGSLIWVHDSGLIMEKRNGRPYQVTGLNVDITEKKFRQETDDTLLNLLETLKTLDIGTWIWDTRTDHVKWDKKAKEIFELPDDMHGFSFKELVHPDDIQFAAFFENLRKGIGGTCVFRWIKKGKVRWLHSVASPVGDPKKGVITGVSSDVTDQMEKEKLLKNRQELLEQKNLELQSFLHIASHDLQEPLRKISYYCEKIKTSPNISPKVAEYSKWTIEGTNRMSKLLMDLLDYSRAGSNMNISRFTLAEVVGIAHATLLSMIEEHNGILTILNDVEIQGDRALWEQLMQNLISNAIKYSREDIPPLVKVSGEVMGENLVITVEDNGIGVQWDYRERIFEPFKRLHTREKFPGTGMGLALCKRIVEKHHGKIELTSSSSTGSVFQIQIPRRIPRD